MSNVRAYTYRGGAWDVTGPEALALLVPSSSAPDQMITIDNAAGSLSAFANATTHVYLSVQDASVMVRFAGTGSANAPTSACGHVLTASSNHLLAVGLATCAHFIRQTSTNAILFATELY